jgi:hypothetical protein
MPNMSYCRFENTSKDLADCVDALEELSVGNGEPLSARELEAAKTLVSKAIDLLNLVAEFRSLDLDTDELERHADNILEEINRIDNPDANG